MPADPVVDDVLDGNLLGSEPLRRGPIDPALRPGPSRRVEWPGCYLAVEAWYSERICWEGDSGESKMAASEMVPAK